MKLIVITTPDFRKGESDQIISLFENGLETLHLRKPNSDITTYEHLLASIPTPFLGRIVLHEHFSLTDKLPLCGVHLNRRNPSYRGNRCVQISKSCHSLEEIRSASSFDYLFLSPIFNSISKSGYNAAFSDKQLETASQNGWINENVIALGGIDISTLSKIKRFSFGGAALLGAVWQNFDIENFKRLQDIAHSL
ncbi:MAG: thiamine phosphate synthase [Paludibacteraceae bacterium]